MGFYHADCASNYIRQKGQWERVAFVYDFAKRTQSIIVNGVLQASCNNVDAYIGTDTVFLGSWVGRRWRGQIADVKIFAHALSPKQVDREMLGIHQFAIFSFASRYHF